MERPQKTEEKITHEYLSQFKATDIGNDTDLYANAAQKKIDQYYVQEYTKLYQQVYAAHFNTAAPEEVAKDFACRIYEENQNACCVIL